jgi:hypothetical protein
MGAKGGRSIGLTTLPSSYADCLEIREPQPPGTLWSWIGPNRGYFNFVVLIRAQLIDAGRTRVFISGTSMLSCVLVAADCLTATVLGNRISCTFQSWKHLNHLNMSLFRVLDPLLWWSAVIIVIVLNKLVRLLVLQKYEITTVNDLK